MKTKSIHAIYQLGIIFALIILFCSNLFAQVVVDNTSSTSSIASSNTISISHTTGTGSDRLLLVGISSRDRTVSGVTYNGTALTLVGAQTSSNNAKSAIYRLIAPPNGTFNVVVTFSGNVTRGAVVGAMTFAGVNQTTPLGTYASSVGRSTSASLNVTSASSELVFNTVSVQNKAIIVGTSQTQRWNINTASENTGGGCTKTGSASTNVFWTLASDDWSMSGVSIKPIATADISIAKTVNNASPTIGNNVVFTLTATNNGPDAATNVIVQDLLPNGFQYVSSTPPSGTTYASGTGVWNIGSMANGASRVMTITATILCADNYLNQAVATLTQPDPSSGNNSAAVAVNPQNSVSTTRNICFGQTFNLTTLNPCNIPSGTNVTWHTNATATSLNKVGTPTAVGAGTYYVAFEDNTNMCYSPTTAFTINVTSQINISGSLTHVSCVGGSNGAINITASGGISPYSYNWGGGVISEDRSGLSMGTYTVTVTGANGCTGTASFTITQPSSGIIANAFLTNVNCNGVSTGAINQSVLGGSAPYTYLWNGGATTKDRSGLAAGTYSVTITDNNGCTLVKMYTLTQPSPLDGSTSLTQPSCGAAGSIDVTTTGGTSPYTFLWNDGATTEDRSGLAFGNYNLTITDDKGCTDVVNVTLNDPMCGSGLTVCTSNMADVFSTNTDPFVDTYTWTVPTGAVIVSGQGTPSIMVNWSGAPTGSGQICVKTQNACGESVNYCKGVIITTISANASHDIACTGQNLQLYANGGNTYSWSGPAGFTSSSQNPTIYGVSNAQTGIYTVTVTSTDGCTASASTAVTIQSGPNLSTVVNTSACGQSIGSVDLSVSGGASPYSYTWSNGATVQDISSLSANNYFVTVTDNNGCISTSYGSVGDVNGPTVILTATPVSCFNDNNGAISKSLTGGTSPIQLFWSNGSVTMGTDPNPAISSLSADTYSVIATDVYGCVGVDVVEVTQPYPLQLNGVKTDILCFGNNTGMVDLSVIGGTSPYSYLWSNAASTQDLAAFNAGTYTVTVTDANGCTATSAFTLTQSASALSASATASDVLCFGESNGWVDLMVSGGTSPNTYLWSNAATTQDISGLNAGTYNVTITDDNGCVLNGTSATVDEPAILSLSHTQQNVFCFGGATGSINLTIAGGTTPFSISWSNGATTEDISTLVAGVYGVTITDANECQQTSGVTITEPTLLQASITQFNVLCFGNTTGSINLTTSGGTLPHFYSWSNGATTEDIASLGAGTYTVTVTDNLGCSTTTQATITQADALSASNFVTDVTCNGGTNGAITLNVIGGTINYSYTWTGGLPSQKDQTGLVAGSYSVTITDQNGCTYTDTYSIGQPTALSVLGTGTDITCNGAGNGSINLTASGGTAPYTYAWSNGSNSEDINTLDPGNYSVTVTDFNFCTDTKSFTINEPTILTASGTEIANCPSQSNGSITLNVSGGNLPYATFNWSDVGLSTQNRNGLTAGSYTVTITDNKGCTTTASFELIPLSISVTGVDKSCLFNNGQAFSAAAGGESPYTYMWSNGSTDQNISGLPTATYIVTVTDNVGCTITGQVTLIDPVCIPPIAYNDYYTTLINTPISGTVATNDDPTDDLLFSNLEFYPLSFINPSEGIITWDPSSDGSFYFVPATNFVGVIYVNYRVCDSLGLCDDAVLQIDVIGTPDWTITKTSTTAPLNSYDQVGDVLTYEIVLDNTGDVSLYDIIVTDAGADPGSIVLVSGDINLNDTMEISESWTYSAEHTIVQADLDAGSYNNTASANGSSDAGPAPLVSDSEVIPAIQTPSITLIKTGTYNDLIPAGYNAGDEINYAFEVTNSGNVTLTNIIVTDLPVTINGGPIPTLAPGASDVTTFTATHILTQSDIDFGSFTNTAEVTGTAPDNTDVTDTDDDIQAITQNPALTVTKTQVSGPSPVTAAGQIIGYEIVVTNTGNQTLTNVSTTDILPDGSNGVLSGPLESISNNGEINVGESWTYSISYTVTQSDIDAGLTLVNNVSVVTDEVPGPTTDDASTPVDQNPSLYIIKGSSLDMGMDGLATPGDLITYTYQITNNGNLTLNSVNIDENIAQFTGTGSLPMPQFDSASLSSPEGTLLLGETATYTAVYAITQIDINAGQVVNQAVAQGDTPDGGTLTDDSDSSNPMDPNETGTPSDPNGNDPTTTIIPPSPPIPNAGPDFTKTCVNNPNGAEIGEATQPGHTYLWSPGVGLSSTTTSNPTANPLTTTTYTVTITNTASGLTSTDQVVVTVDITLPTTNAGPDFTKTCVSNISGAEIGEATQPDHTYSWSPGAGLSSTTTSNPTANPLATTTYTVTITDSSNGCSSTDDVTVNVNTTLPTINAGSDFTKTCVDNPSGTSIGELAQPGHTYVWSPGFGLNSSTIASPTANPIATTTYSVTITNSINGCTAIDDVEVFVDNTPPIVYAGSDFTKTCVLNTNGGAIGEALQLGHSYLWSPSAGLSSATSSNPTANPISTTSYTVTITDTATGCTFTDVVDITVYTTPPTVNAGLNFTKTCVVNVNGATIGEPEQLGHSYQWSPAAGLSSTSESNPLANPMVTTTYIVTITDENTGCSYTDQVVVTVNNEEPTVNAGSDFSKTCLLNINGATIGEAPQLGHTYSWTPGAGLSSTTVSNPIANPLSTTTYTVTITKTITGCSSTDQVEVTVNNNPPTISAGTNFTKTCVSNENGSEIGGLGQFGHSYMWSPALGLSSANGSNPIANPSGTTTYTVTITDNSSGCTSTDQVVVTVNNTPPIANAGSGFTKTCVINSNGASIGEAAQIGHSYLWSPGAGLNSTIVSNPIANPVSTTVYTATITDILTGCTSSDIVAVTVNTNPPLVNAGLDFTKTCVSNSNGASIGEVAQLGHTYLWSPGAGLSSTTVSGPIANPSTTTTYVVTITNTVSGCTSTDQVLATVITVPPVADAGPDFTKNCINNSNGAIIGETPQAGYTYSWSPGTGLSSTSIANPFANPTATTIYTVTISDDATGCTATDQIVVSVKHCLSGNVFNDLDGLTNNNVDGMGTNVGGLLYITLLDLDDNPIASTPVNADGSYAFTNLDIGDYTIVLSTAFFGTSPSTPFNWVNTGENHGVMNNDGFIDGFLSITLIGDITDANFGIEQLPFSLGGTAPSVVNPGDTLTQIIPAAMFETVDFDGGFVTSIRLTTFPTNAVSIFVDGIKYTSSNFPIQGIIVPVIGGLPTQEISVDPIDGAINVTIHFVAIDNADREDQSPGIVVQPFGTVGIGGNVYNDLGGLITNVHVDGSGTNAGGLYVTLMSGSMVIATTQVDPDGTYSFTGLDAGSYTLILTTINGATLPSLPINWVNTGENFGVFGNDGSTNGILTVIVSGYESNANFGIEQLPNSIGGTAPSALNPGGTESKIVPAETFESTDPDGGIVTSIRITGFPSNASSITINGITYYSYNFPSMGVIVPVIGGLPTHEISVDPIDGSVTVAIPFVAIDNANREDLTAGFALQPFVTTAISGKVFNDIGGLVTNINIDGSGTNVGGQMYVTIINENNVAIATTPVAADGTYMFTGINGGIYSLVLSTSSFGMNANVPSNWVNTGENHGLVGNDGNTNGALSLIVSGEVTQANFGIEQLPSANVESIPIQVNPGGTNFVNVPASIFGGTDPDGGTIIGILITDFPTNATSILINGTYYTSSTFPYGGVAVPTNAQGEPIFPISIDPIDGAIDVVIPYVTIDNAAKQSMLEGSATLPFICNPPVISTPQDVSICSGQSIIITTTTTGGVEPYLYQWSNSNVTTWSITVSPAMNTNYVITVTDAVGCTAINDILISVNEKPTLNVHSDAILCFGESITVSPTAQGGEPPYTYYVNSDPLLGPQFVMDANSTTTYIFIVEDANGCGNYDEVNITWPSASLACDVSLVNEVCCVNGNDGSAVVNVQGGYSPYTYHWDNNENTSTASNLNAGIHNVTVTDANGCTTQCSVNMNIKEVDLSLAKLVNNENPSEGESIMFTLVIQNASTNNATGVVIRDDLPLGLTVPTNISHGGIYSAGFITWSNLTIGANTSLQLTYTTSILSFNQNQYINTAQVTALDQLDSDSNPNNGADTNNNGSVGSTDADSSFDSMDEDDGDDAVVFKSSALGNYLWIDSNGNGMQDANEVGLNGQTIYLYNEFDQLIASTVTSINPIDTTKDGYYIFNNIAPGNYYVSANVISNYLFTTPNMNAVSDNLDSDLDGSNGPNTTALYSIGVNDRNFTVDIGIYKSASIGDFVWEDINTVNFPGNSIQDANEEGRNGVTVYLYDAITNLVVDQMVTQNHPVTGEPGWYTFYDLPAGQYYVQFELPANFQFVTPHQGPNMMDSDVSDLALGTTDLITILPADSIINVDAGLVVAIVLPVDFILFEGHYNSTTKENELTWITASEVNCDYYLVERSIEANNFEQIGKVDGHGTSNVKNTYFFNDDDTNTSGIYYYKLRQLDIDGRVNYSGVIKIIVPQNNVTDVSIMPNPALDFIQLNVSAQKGEVLNAAIYDVSGKFIMNLVHNQKLTDNVEDIRVDVSMMPRGIYLVRSTVNNAEFVHKLVLLH